MEEYTIIVDCSSFAIKDGLYLKAVRNTGGSIERLAEMTETEIDPIFKGYTHRFTISRTANMSSHVTKTKTLVSAG